MASAEQMARFFAEQERGSKTPPEPKQHKSMKRTEMKRGKRLKPVSEKQAVRNSFLAGVKAERIAMSIRALGYVECSNCPKRYEGHSVAHQNLDLHHETKRSRGQGYRPGQGFGVDEPGNLVLLCRGCHKEAEGSEPMFSQESA